MFLVLALLYAACVFSLSRAPVREGARVPFWAARFTPHGAFAAGSPYRAMVALCWGGLFGATLFLHSQLALEMKNEAGVALSGVFGVLLLGAILSFPAVAQQQPGHDLRSDRQTQAPANPTEQLILVGDEQTLIELHAVPSLAAHLTTLPIHGTRLVATAAFHHVQVPPGIQVLPWSESVRTVLVEPLAAAIETAQTQARKALEAEAAAARVAERLGVLEADVVRLNDEKRDLSGKLAGVRTRHRGGNASVDYALMSADDLVREREQQIRLLRVIDDVIAQKKTDKPATQVALPLSDPAIETT